MLDYKLLHALAMVIDHGGFERAAEALCRTQSAVSQRIRQLEDQTGCILVTRSNPPEPTEAGRRLLRHYRQVAALETDLSDIMAETGSGETGGNASEQGKRPPSYAPIAVGVNADSLGSWFMQAALPFLKTEAVVLDLRLEDQEETHRFFRNGEVAACVSARSRPFQGCRCLPLGRMNYRLCAASDFADRWLPSGLVPEALARAPAVIFNRKDGLHHRMLARCFGEDIIRSIALPPAHYIPSYEMFGAFIAAGLGFGMVPDLQRSTPMGKGLVDLMPGRMESVSLYWHCWNLPGRHLQALTDAILSAAPEYLETDASDSEDSGSG